MPLQIETKLLTEDLKQYLKKFKVVMPEHVRIGLLDSLDRVGSVATSKYMDRAEVIDPRAGTVASRKTGSQLNIRSGRLARSINQLAFGRSAEGIRKVFFAGKDIMAILGSEVPYARIHEKGGTTSAHEILPKKSGGVLVFRGAEGNLVFAKKVNHPGSNIPARPYLEPALEDSRNWIINHLEQQISKATVKAE